MLHPSPPGPPGLPIVGHLPQYWRDRLGFLVDCAARYGDVVMLRIGGPTLLLSGPDDIKHVLVTHASRYAKTSRISGAVGLEWLGRSVTTLSGSEHHARRRTLQPAFERKSLHAFAAPINAAVEAWARDRRPGERLDMAAEMRSLTRRVMTESLLGADTPPGNQLQAAIAARRQYHEYIVGSALPVSLYRPVRLLFRYRAAIRQIDAVLDSALRQRRSRVPDGDDMLSRWVRARDDDGSALTDSQIRAEALAFIDSGYETVAATLAWTWHLLGRHPEIDAVLSAELRDVLGGRAPQIADLPSLRYTVAVLHESLRLYPPAWNFARRALRSDVLPCGVAVAPGTKLILCQYVAHRNPRHFDDPDAFRPDRFISTAGHGRPRFSYFPFGGGPHVCLGEGFAELESFLVVAALAQRFRFEPEPGHPVTMNADFALRPRNGVWVRVRPPL